MARTMNAVNWAANWSTGMNQATDKIRQGVQATTVAPSVGLLAAKDRMRARWLAAIDSPSFESAVQRVTLPMWQQAMISKGLPRISDGVRLAQPKVQGYATRAIPVYQQLQTLVRAMPKTTLNDSVARVRAWMEGIQNAKVVLRGN